jgi:hypothetical protein
MFKTILTQSRKERRETAVLFHDCRIEFAECLKNRQILVFAGWQKKEIGYFRSSVKPGGNLCHAGKPGKNTLRQKWRRLGHWLF